MLGNPDRVRFIAWSAKVLYPKWVDMPLKRRLKVFAWGIGIILDVDNWSGDAWVNGLEHQSFNQEVMRPWVQIPAEPVIKIVGSAL